MKLRQVFMRLHQGEYGIVNLIAVLFVAMTFFISIVASIYSYLLRRPKGELGLPQPPATFQPDIKVIGLIVILALIFPAFAISAFGVFVLDWGLKRLRHKKGGVSA